MADALPVLQALSWVALALPPAIGAYALASLDRFRRGAFGLYAKGATAFMAAIAFGILYYTLVASLYWREGTLQSVWEEPMGATAWLLHLQSVVAAATLVSLVVAANCFLAIVKPAPRTAARESLEGSASR